MYGGLKKTASRLALVAAAGVLSTNAFAADLGGDCCADLEERVAELEATTARKGTRKTTLEIWGQVNRAIVYWRDGYNSNTVLGTDNVNASTRFGLRGMAKIAPSVTAGYSIVMELGSGGRSTSISQFNDKTAITGVANTATYAGNYGANDAVTSMREANWWIESSSVGRLTVGRFVSGIAGPQGTIDLAGIGMGVASGSVSLVGSGLTFRTGNSNGINPSGGATARGTTTYSNYTLGNTTDGVGEAGTRANGIMWTSPVFAGFSLGASLVGAANADSQCANVVAGNCVSSFHYGPQWSAVAKYANEFNGFRVAAALGYENAKNENNTSMVSVGTSANLTSDRPNASTTSLSASVLHVPTGLFAQAAYNVFTRGHDSIAGGVASNFANGTLPSTDSARQFQIQAGITKNWFGIGNTSLYGEYTQTKNGFNTFGLEGLNGNPTATSGGVVGFGVTAANSYQGDANALNKMWGLGVTQNIDAAAMQLYAGYRNFSMSSDNCTAAGGCKDISLFVTGGIIKF